MASTGIKECPKALGTVQIIIGAVVFLFGIVLKAVADSVNNINSVNSNVMYWGSISFISSGALSVASLDNRCPSVVKASLAMNVISAVTAIAAVSNFSTDLSKSPESECSRIYYRRELAIAYCKVFWKHTIGNSRVLQGFSLLEFFVSIATFVLTWIIKGSTETTSSVSQIDSPPEENPNSP
ncbi:hypothetical protein PGIGA_G00113340 [Pangasianodon gigas]|uniref:Uncharacterized protein n=1 Tax=Pangasianodon gigas TaxID=30993 RepID=A0ACC5WAL8_PANGG|nr:hypothetical protein [Pangasianodon gigas]